MSRPALLLVSHGSSDPGAVAVSEGVASAVRELLGDVFISTAYLDHAAPAPVVALLELVDAGHPRVVIVPFFLSAAYHVGVDLPAAMTAARAARPQLVVYAAGHLGPDPLVVDAVLLRLADAGVDAQEPVLLAAAGSSDEAGRAEVAELAALLAASSGRRVVLAFAAGGPPTPSEALNALAAEGLSAVAVAPFLLGPGRFSAAIASAAAGAPAGLHTTVSAVLGAHPALVELVCQRYRQAELGTVRSG